jgi:hypothetical protein
MSIVPGLVFRQTAPGFIVSHHSGRPDCRQSQELSHSLDKVEGPVMGPEHEFETDLFERGFSH